MIAPRHPGFGTTPRPAGSYVAAAMMTNLLAAAFVGVMVPLTLRRMQIDPALAAFVLEGMLPMAPMMGQVGVFGEGPSGTVDDDAPAQERLLDLTGRRP